MILDFDRPEAKPILLDEMRCKLLAQNQACPGTGDLRAGIQWPSAVAPPRRKAARYRAVFNTTDGEALNLSGLVGPEVAGYHAELFTPRIPCGSRAGAQNIKILLDARKRLNDAHNPVSVLP